MDQKRNSGDNDHRFIRLSSSQNGKQNNSGKKYSSDRKIIGYSERKKSASDVKPENYKIKATSAGDKNGINSKDNLQRKRKSVLMRKRRTFFGLILLILVVAIIFAFFTRKNGLSVTVGDKELGFVKNEKNAEENILSTVKAQIETERGTTIQFVDEIKFKPVHLKTEAATSDFMISEIRKNINYNVSAAVIVVDGNDAAVLNNKAEAQKLLDDVINEYIPADSKIDKEKSGFVQKVEVVEKYVASEKISSVEEVKNKFLSGNKTTKTYTVKRGDTLSRIAAEKDMSYKEIFDLNPNVTEKNLIAGHQINVYELIPFLSVRTTETVSFIEKQLKTVEYKNDSTLKKGTQKVIQQGKDGQKEVISQIIRVNGFEESSKVVEEKTLVEPVTEIIAVGTA